MGECQIKLSAYDMNIRARMNDVIASRERLWTNLVLNDRMIERKKMERRRRKRKEEEMKVDDDGDVIKLRALIE